MPAARLLLGIGQNREPTFHDRFAAQERRPTGMKATHAVARRPNLIHRGRIVGLKGQIEGIVPGIGKITNAYNNVSSITETYKNVVGGNITAVTQISSAISTFSNSVASKIGSVARSIGKKFGF